MISAFVLPDLLQQNSSRSISSLDIRIRVLRVLGLLVGRPVLGLNIFHLTSVSTYIILYVSTKVNPSKQNVTQM